MVGSEFDLNNMKARSHPAFYQYFRLVAVAWWSGALVPNTTADLSTVADHVHLYDHSVPIFWFLLPVGWCDVSQSSNGFISDFFNILKWPPQSRDLNSTEHLWDVVEWKIHIRDVQLTNRQQLCDAIMTIRTKISKECEQHLVESVPWVSVSDHER